MTKFVLVNIQSMSMMHSVISISCVLLGALSFSHAAPDGLEIKAIVPTSAGQIGINPVSIYETSTAFDPSDSVPFKTITATDATSTLSAPFAVVTQASGDVTFPTTPDGKTQLQALFDEVAAACLGQSKAKRGTKVKRSGQCELDQFSRPGAGGGILEFDLPGIAIPTFTAGDVAVALQGVPAAVAVAFIAYVIGNGKVSDDTAVNIPASNIVSQSSTTSAVPTTTNDDFLDSVYTADDSIYTVMAQDVLARISADASVVSELFGAAPTPTPLPAANCDRTTLTNMETTLFKELGSNFCKDTDLNVSNMKDLTNKDIGTDAFGGYSFHLEWKQAGDVCGSLVCTDMFDAFSSNCAYDSHSMWSTGTLTVDCGTASYIIKPPDQPAPAPTPTPAPTPPPVALNSPTCYNGPPLKLDDIQGKVNDFCSNAVDSGWHYEEKETVTPDEIQNNRFYTGVAGTSYADVLVQDGTKSLALQVSASQRSCAPGADYKIDFKAMGVDECVANFMIAVNGCAPFVIPSDSDYWKMGGMNSNDCIDWTVQTVGV